ncbi:DUF4397 domain-containing protein [Paraclostridium ghonii]|uniref:DUF4397 domain-containing protein n=1 Tax=Paraclostridium ghonii TaxID=29358 RepID=UPI00202D0195|nr:DUF4397 domain-containing protein [Paeniclostridium ghonii]MCM0167817.1 DUF4397 domain-containing protein [Paeniclostridium ghonii]
MKIRVNNDASYIRVFNATANSDEIDVYVNDILVFSNVRYREFVPYTPTFPGDYTVKVYECGNDKKLILEQELTIAGGNVGTLVITGIMPKLMMLAVFENPNEEICDSNAKFRIAHLSPTTEPIDLTVNNVKMIDEIPFGKRTNYAQVPTGIYDFVIEGSNIEMQENKDKVRISKKIELKDKKIYTIYLIGDVADIEIIQSLDIITYMNK